MLEETMDTIEDPEEMEEQAQEEIDKVFLNSLIPRSLLCFAELCSNVRKLLY